jgi:hypothetical protein
LLDSLLELFSFTVSAIRILVVDVVVDINFNVSIVVFKNACLLAHVLSKNNFLNHTR